MDNTTGALSSGSDPGFRDFSVQLRRVTLEMSLVQRRGRGFALRDGIAAASRVPRRMTVLDDVSLTIGRGERVGVIGHNGAGKTALLRIVAGIYPPTAGACETRGRVSCLFNTALHGYGDATALEFIVLVGLTRGLSRKQVSSRIPAIARFSEIRGHIHAPIRTLSKGMRTRLSFAIAICIDWDVLILDEEIGTSDLRFLAKARRRIKDAEDGKTLMVASHNSRVIRDLCDRAVWIHKGRIRASGGVDELLAAYRAHHTKRRRDLEQTGG